MVAIDTLSGASSPADPANPHPCRHHPREGQLPSVATVWTSTRRPASDSTVTNRTLRSGSADSYVAGSFTASGSLRRTAPAPTARRGPAHVPGPQTDIPGDSLSNAPNATNPCKSAPDEDNTDMTTPTFRYGRRPPKNAPALRLVPLLTGVLPAPASHVDYGTD